MDNKITRYPLPKQLCIEKNVITFKNPKSDKFR